MLMRALLPPLAILHGLELAVYSENAGDHLIDQQRIHIFQTAPAFQSRLHRDAARFAKKKKKKEAERRPCFNCSGRIYARLAVSKCPGTAALAHGDVRVGDC